MTFRNPYPLSAPFCNGIGANYNRFHLLYSDDNNPTERAGLLEPEVAKDLFFSYNAVINQITNCRF
jgi:hypothetical protein